MKVSAVMTKDVGTCVQDETLDKAARIMLERDCGVVPIVVDRGSRKLAGIVTDRDICMAACTTGRMLGQIPLDEAMTRNVTSCRASDETDAAERLMQQAQVHRLPVLDDSNRLVGVLAIADLVRAGARGSREGVMPIEVGETIAAIRRPRSLEAARAT
jgi:CBS domain-containing protein